MSRRNAVRPLIVRILVLLALAAGLVQAARAIRTPAGGVRNGLLSTVDDQRRATYGGAWVDGIEALRAGIPPGGTYVALAPCEYGCQYWARYDLSPRRMHLLDRAGTRDPSAWSAALRRRRDASVVVIESADGPPRTTTAAALLAGTPDMPAAKRDEGLVVAVDTPVNGAEVTDPFRVDGWCQEPWERPCAEVRLFLDGFPATVERFERFPRPDVAQVLPHMGPCERAGYRAFLKRSRWGAGRSSRLFVIFVTDDGRWRKVGPIEVRWK